LIPIKKKAGLLRGRHSGADKKESPAEAGPSLRRDDAPA
jgi:hypothetical protein